MQSRSQITKKFTHSDNFVKASPESTGISWSVGENRKTNAPISSDIFYRWQLGFVEDPRGESKMVLVAIVLL